MLNKIKCSIFLSTVLLVLCCSKKNSSSNSSDGALAESPNAPLITTSPYDPNYSYFVIRILLEGAWNGSGMKTTLGPLLPTTDPYGVGVVSPNINTMPNVVDWVKIEFREANSPYTLIKAFAGLLMSDSRILSEDGVTPLKVDMEGEQTVVIRHRNHLAVQLNNTLSLVKGRLAGINTTKDMDSVTSDLNHPYNLARLGSRFGLIVGDVDNNCYIEPTDGNIIRNAIGISGYQNEDINMDGVVDITDYHNLNLGHESMLCGH